MRPERNPLDLNNLPDDYTRDATTHHHDKQILEDTSSCAAAGRGGYKKKKNGGKDDSSKVYECRFCSLKFCKSQALGGHMNRHRQERETETLNRARQLVFTNDNILTPPPHHLSGSGGYHQPGDPTLQLRPIYPSRLFSGGSSSAVLPLPPHQQPYMYTTTSSRLMPYQSSQYPQQPPPTMNDYFIGHVLPNSSQFGSQNPNYGPPLPNTQPQGNYTCIGAPVGNVFGSGNKGGGGSGEMAMQNENDDDDDREGLLDLNNDNRSRRYTGTHQQGLDSSLINRYQDGF